MGHLAKRGIFPWRWMSPATNRSRPIDILVSSAGYGSHGALEDVPLSEARNQFEVNVFGAATLARRVLPGQPPPAYTRTSTSSCRPSAPSSRSAA